MQPLLKVDDLTKSYPLGSQGLSNRRQRFYALDRVSLMIAAGETVGLIGESGSGKSTLARILAKLIPADSGEVYLREQEILHLSPRAFSPWRRSIQMIFQDPDSSLNPRFTMEETLLEPLIGFNLGSAAERRRRIREMLPVVGLEDSILKRYPHQLSGGQKQRVAILGVLLVDPELIIADEIVSALDLSVQAQILNLWRDLRSTPVIRWADSQQHVQPATLFISHNLDVVGWLADRILVIYRGQIVEEGSVEAICLDPLHPYTQMLYSALKPQNSVNQAALLDATEGGCVFCARCLKRQQRCLLHVPEIKTYSEHHKVRCHLYA